MWTEPSNLPKHICLYASSQPYVAFHSQMGSLKDVRNGLVKQLQRFDKIRVSSWRSPLFNILAPTAKSEQQQQKNGMPVAQSKKRQSVTPSEVFQDSDPEDDYDKS